MKICKLKPDSPICNSCAKAHQYSTAMPDCSACISKSSTYELLSLGFSMSLPKAFVQVDGRISMVDINRIYDIKDVPDATIQLLEDKEVDKLINKFIDKGECKDNGDGTEKLFVSIDNIRKVLKEIVEG